MRTRRLLLSSVLGLILLASAPARAQVSIVDSHASIDPLTLRTSFSITFSSPPDFFTVDGFGRARDLFQYWIDFSPPYAFNSIQVIIRSAEIHQTGKLSVCEAAGSGGPGGWGPVRGEADYQLVGNTLTFEFPLQVIGDPDGTFWYELQSYFYGGTVTQGHQRIVTFGGSTTKLDGSTWGRLKQLYSAAR